MLIRVRHSGGTFRVTIPNDGRLGMLSKEVHDRLKSAFFLSLDPAGTEKLEHDDELLTNLGLEHGTMVHVQAIDIEEDRASLLSPSGAEPIPDASREEDQEQQQHHSEYDAEMEEAIAIARAADAAEAAEEAPRAPDSTRREALLGPHAEAVEDDAELARLMAARDMESRRSEIAATRLFGDRDLLERGGRRVQNRRRRQLEDFGIDSIAGEEDSELPLPAAIGHQLPTGEPTNDDDDAALQAALLATSGASYINQEEDNNDAELARALAMSIAAQEPSSSAPENRIPQQQSQTPDNFQLGYSDENDPALQSALFGAGQDFQRQQAEEEDFQRAIALSKLEAEKHFHATHK